MNDAIACRIALLVAAATAAAAALFSPTYGGVAVAFSLAGVPGVLLLATWLRHGRAGGGGDPRLAPPQTDRGDVSDDLSVALGAALWLVAGGAAWRLAQRLTF